jgi:hypothetical protein
MDALSCVPRCSAQFSIMILHLETCGVFVRSGMIRQTI